jgi:hypothetical protein
VFYEVFSGGLNNSGLREVRVQILPKNNFQIFLAHPEFVSGFSTSRKKFQGRHRFAKLKKPSRLLLQIIRNDQFIDIPTTGAVAIDHPLCRNPLNVIIGIEIVKE